MTLVSIITPTYNRGDRLPNLFSSLKAQSDQAFEWIIVDDGSTDDTPVLCRTWEGQAAWPLQYVQKANGGKHTALNAGIQQARGELIFLVDSDDTLTTDAIATVREVWKSRSDRAVCGISFLRIRKDGSVVGDRFPHDGELASYIEMRINRRIRGDKAEVWRTDVLRQFPFPEVDGERFLMEAAVWGKIGARYRMKHMNRGIYVSEYLPDGLTLSGAALTVLCPVGAAHGVRWATAAPVNLPTRLRMTWRLIAYELLARQSLRSMMKRSGHALQILLNFPVGLALYCYWRLKFRHELRR
jgi:glycosyltransferase involved in cell wall biosynthesis